MLEKIRVLSIFNKVLAIFCIISTILNPEFIFLFLLCFLSGLWLEKSYKEGKILMKIISGLVFFSMFVNTLAFSDEIYNLSYYKNKFGQKNIEQSTNSTEVDNKSSEANKEDLQEVEKEVAKPLNENLENADNNSILPNIYEQIGEGEKITGVSIEGNTLTIKVDLTNANPSPLTMEDLIDSRVSSISEGALENSKISDEWGNLKIDFGSYGYIVLDKSLVKDDGYGPYFTYPDGKMRFELQK